MKELLNIEWLKIKNYNPFIIISSLFALGVFTTNYIVYTVTKEVVNKADTAPITSILSPYNFDHTWQTTSYATGYLLILPALLLITLVTNEYSFKTHRQNIIDGWSRMQFIDVKIALAVIFALVSTLLVILSALLFGFASGTSFSMEGFSHVGFFFLKALSYFMIALLISVWIKRTGFAVGVYIIYMGAENIISQLLDVWSVKLRTDSKIDLGSLGDYLPMNASDGLLTFPDNPAKSAMRSVMPTDYTWLVICFAIVYLVVFFLLTRRNIRVSDL